MYSGEILKVIRKFEKVDYKLRKGKLGVSFSIKCQLENVIANFLKFCLTKHPLKTVFHSFHRADNSA